MKIWRYLVLSYTRTRFIAKREILTKSSKKKAALLQNRGTMQEKIQLFWSQKHFERSFSTESPRSSAFLWPELRIFYSSRWINFNLWAGSINFNSTSMTSQSKHFRLIIVVPEVAGQVSLSNRTSKYCDKIIKNILATRLCRPLLRNP